jgi:hypothetical protein
MNLRLFAIERPPNPLLQFLYIIVGGVLLVGAVLMGAVILAVVVVAAVVLVLVFWARTWWLGRTSGHVRNPRRDAGRGAAEGQVIEVEYTVVEERDPRDRDA